jgi:NADPH-dependent 2,4-dienoyl-CoA reductase/sulfur reductase-like enzyme
MERIVIVGASLAGLRAAETLRSSGFEGRVSVVGAEPHHPYDRPPLSKKLLAGEWEPDRIALRKPDDMGSLGIDWHLGAPAIALDTDAREVALAGGASVGFDGLIIATGAVPRPLPGQPDLPHVMALRTVDDALALRSRIAGGGSRVVVIGAGFIGLEVAATARMLDNEVVVLEGATAPLIRGLGAEMGTAVAACHGDHGVKVRCGVAVTAIDEAGVHLEGGEVVPADTVLVGIGVMPATDWLETSGLELHDGVMCDATLATAVPGVYAAGDVARWYNELFDAEMRVEHWTNAAEQGAVAAKNLLAVQRGDEPEPYAPVPFFWSDQYDRRIQFLGRATAGDEVQVVAGSPDDRQFLALYGSNGRLNGALGLNMPRLVMPYRKLLAARASWDEALEFAAGQAG